MNENSKISNGMKEITYPLRVNKYLAYSGLCSRREADELIKKKKVYINGEIATLGQVINELDKVELHRGYSKDFVYVAYNKPRGVVTHSPKENEVGVMESIDIKDVFPVGRLDKDSEGLLILTNDGRVTDRLLSPGTGHEKEYIVTVDKPLKKTIVSKIASGVNIEGYLTKPAKAKVLGTRTLSIILTEGKRHQIRRMLAALKYTTLKLRRVRVSNIKILGLEQNETRIIKGEELEVFLKNIKLN